MPITPNRVQARTKFEHLYGAPLGDEFIEEWELPKYDAMGCAVAAAEITRPNRSECDKVTLIKLEEAYINENRILNLTHKYLHVLPAALLGT
jgi:hypothetical protein